MTKKIQSLLFLLKVSIPLDEILTIDFESEVLDYIRGYAEVEVCDRWVIDGSATRKNNCDT